MAELTIDLDDLTRAQLANRAEAHGRTPAAEAKRILQIGLWEPPTAEDLKGMSMGEALARLFDVVGFEEGEFVRLPDEPVRSMRFDE